jgi:regulator of RNase E activity RraA
MRVAAFVLFSVIGWTQPPDAGSNPPLREIPAHMRDKLSPADRELFSKLISAELESVWAAVVAEGYPNCFINELTPLNPSQRMIGRARTIRYLPNRKDLRERLYSAGPQLNYKASEDAQPGDILVFDAAGETRSAVTGNVTATRLMARGGAGMIADGAFRDVPALAAMPLQIYLRRGQAAGVAPIQMSVDYQVPVRIGEVTVIPGDILYGERHGILVIPAGIAEKAVERALATVEREEFQRGLLLRGESIYNVYPKLSEENQKKYDAYRKRKGR